MKLSVLISYLIFLTRKSVNSQSLKAEKVATFPNSIYKGSPVYDGDDMIYIVGGTNGTSFSSRSYFGFHTFNVTSNLLSEFSNLTYGTASGQTGAQMDSHGRIFHFAERSNFVRSFDPKSYEDSERSSRIAAVLEPSTIRLENDVVAFLGGDETRQAFLTFDMKTNDSKLSDKTLPFPLSLDAVATSIGNKAIVFGSDDPSYPSAFELNLDTLEIGKQSGSDFPFLSYAPDIALHNGYIYVIGGYNLTEDNQTPTAGIIQLDPNTFNWRFIPVENFVIQADQFFMFAPATVFVDKLNRIYFFGGQVMNMKGDYGSFRDEIWFIDMTPLDNGPPTSTIMPSTSPTLNPNIFSCVDKTDGTYPHPYECDMFIICQNGETELFECPPPLLFDPAGERCDLPQNVACDLSCLDKPDDQYPHPHDCVLFIICHGGQMDVFRCPEPLVFDPELKKCNIPELVNCLSN